MSVLIVVLLVLFLMIEAGSSVSNNSETNKHRDSFFMEQERWERVVMYSNKEEETLNEATYSPSRYWEMEKAALEVIHLLPGLEYAEFKDKGIPRKHGASREIVRLIEAVQHGRVPHSITHTIYPLENALDMYVSKDAYVEFGRWIERTIRENGVPNAELYAQALGGYKALVWGPFQRLFGPYRNGNVEVKNIRVTDPLWIEKINAFSAELCEELNAPIIERNKAHLRLEEEFRAYNERREAERREAEGDISH